jgi:hypothetical protein
VIVLRRWPDATPSWKKRRKKKKQKREKGWRGNKCECGLREEGRRLHLNLSMGHRDRAGHQDLEWQKDRERTCWGRSEDGKKGRWGAVERRSEQGVINSFGYRTKIGLTAPFHTPLL